MYLHRFVIIFYHFKLGKYGLKSDLCDVTKYMDDLSLNELLDSSYKYPSLCPEKGKRAPNINENILSSVRKACSILPLQGAVDNNGNGKAVMNFSKPNCSSLNLPECDNKDRGIDESVPCSKVSLQFVLFSHMNVNIKNKIKAFFDYLFTLFTRILVS